MAVLRSFDWDFFSFPSIFVSRRFVVVDDAVDVVCAAGNLFPPSPRGSSRRLEERQRRMAPSFCIGTRYRFVR